MKILLLTWLQIETSIDFVLLEDSASRSEGSIVLEEDNSTVVSLERAGELQNLKTQKKILHYSNHQRES